MTHGTSLPLGKESAICFDAGSKYCPCELAVLGQCVTCSQLRGEDSRVRLERPLPIYSQFAFNGRRAVPGRASHRAPVIRRRDLTGTPKGPRRFSCLWPYPGN